MDKNKQRNHQSLINAPITQRKPRERNPSNSKVSKMNRCSTNKKKIISTLKKNKIEDSIESIYEPQLQTMKKQDKRKKIQSHKDKCIKKKIQSYESVHQKQLIKAQSKITFRKSNQYYQSSLELLNKTQRDRIRKVENILNEQTQQITSIKTKSDAMVIEEMKKSNLTIENKLKEMQQQKNIILKQNEQKIQQLLQNHKKQIKEMNKTFIELKDKLFITEKNYQLKIGRIQQNKIDQLKKIEKKVQEKQEKISQLLHIQQDLYCKNKNLNKQVQQQQGRIMELSQTIQLLKKNQKKLNEQCKKHQQDKQYIKNNSIQVLKFLREEYADVLSRTDDSQNTLKVFEHNS